MKNKISKKEIFNQVRSEIQRLAKDLRPKPIDELKRFISKGTYDKINIGGVPIDITIWAESHGPDKIAVIVDAHRRRFLGMRANVIAEGFYKFSDGSTRDFQESDYYEHGY